MSQKELARDAIHVIEWRDEVKTSLSSTIGYVTSPEEAEEKTQLLNRNYEGEFTHYSIPAIDSTFVQEGTSIARLVFQVDANVKGAPILSAAITEYHFELNKNFKAESKENTKNKQEFYTHANGALYRIPLKRDKLTYGEKQKYYSTLYFTAPREEENYTPINLTEIQEILNSLTVLCYQGLNSSAAPVKAFFKVEQTGSREQLEETVKSIVSAYLADNPGGYYTLAD